MNGGLSQFNAAISNVHTLTRISLKPAGVPKDLLGCSPCLGDCPRNPKTTQNVVLLETILKESQGDRC